MKQILCLAFFFCSSVAEAQTAVKESEFTLDKIVGSIGLPGNFTNNPANRSRNADADQFVSPNLGVKADGKLFDEWAYTITAGADYEGYRRRNDLENSVLSGSAQIRRKFGDYIFKLSYANFQEYDKLFDSHSRTRHRFTASLSQPIELEGGWSVTPGFDLSRQLAQGVRSDASIGAATINFGWTDCKEKQDIACWAIALRPGFRLSYYEHYPTSARKDLQPSIIAEATYQITPDVTLTAAATARYNDSNIPHGTYRRVDFTPQLSLSRVLYER